MKTISQTFALAAAFATIASGVFLSTDAQARSGKQVFIEEYHFKQPMHGYSGHSGNYYCDYQRIPERQCNSQGTNCKITGWTLRQLCQ